MTAEHTGQPPTDHEMVCPSCGATIRSRLADQTDAHQLARLRQQRDAVLALTDEMPDVIHVAAHQRNATWGTVAEYVAARLREITKET